MKKIGAYLDRAWPFSHQNIFLTRIFWSHNFLVERTEICMSCISSRLSACPNYLCCLNCRLRWWSNRFQTVLWKKNPNFQNGLNFAILSSYWIQFGFFSFITSARIWRYGDCLFIENGFGFEIGSAVLNEISAVWKIEFNDSLFL